MKLFEKKVVPDFEALRRNILREGTPERVHHIELLWDKQVKEAVIEKFDLKKGLNENAGDFAWALDVKLMAFLGYDVSPDRTRGFGFPRELLSVETVAPGDDPGRNRSWTNESVGPIQTWEDFERYPWPDPKNVDYSHLEWAEKNFPDGMAVRLLGGHFLEMPTWLLGYETLCMKLYDEPDLVDAVFERCGQLFLEEMTNACAFPIVGAVFAGDDMGFKSQTLLAPDVLREKVLPWHKKAVEAAQANGKLYFLHCCGNVEAIMDDLIDNVKIDAKHSFEDVIVPVTESKKLYGGRVALLGGMDMDFLSRGAEEEVRKRVRETLDVCMPGGGYCLGCGNSVANYIPLENYLAMLDEGRRYAG